MYETNKKNETKKSKVLIVGTIRQIRWDCVCKSIRGVVNCEDKPSTGSVPNLVKGSLPETVDSLLVRGTFPLISERI